MPHDTNYNQTLDRLARSSAGNSVTSLQGPGAPPFFPNQPRPSGGGLPGKEVPGSGPFNPQGGSPNNPAPRIRPFPGGSGPFNPQGGSPNNPPGSTVDLSPEELANHRAFLSRLVGAARSGTLEQGVAGVPEGRDPRFFLQRMLRWARRSGLRPPFDDGPILTRPRPGSGTTDPFEPIPEPSIPLPPIF